MSYLIDHANKTIHYKEYAGDRCGFTTTPVEKREFKNCESYIESLKTQKGYVKCPYCQTFHILAD